RAHSPRPRQSGPANQRNADGRSRGARRALRGYRDLPPGPRRAALRIPMLREQPQPGRRRRSYLVRVMAETLAGDQARYSVVAILLHWLLALALSFQLALGFAMPKDETG